MIFNPEKVNEVKAEEAQSKLKVLKVNVGVAGAFGIGAAASAMTLNIPLMAIASVGFISKLPSILNGFTYFKNEASNAIPEYRFMLKNKKTAPVYEGQFAKLTKAYIEESDSLLEKRFKMEFLSEWLHARDVYVRELKESGLCEYSINLKKNLVKFGLNEDRPLENTSMDSGVVFGGVCENDDLARMQREIYVKHFSNEGIVGSLMIKGASKENILEFLALQDYKLTEKDNLIVDSFLKLTEKEYLDGVKNDKLCSIDVNENTMSLIGTGLKMNNQDGKEIAELLIKIAQKAEKVRLLYVKENPGKAENPVSTHRTFNTDIVLMEATLYESSKKKNKLFVWKSLSGKFSLSISYID